MTRMIIGFVLHNIIVLAVFSAFIPAILNEMLLQLFAGITAFFL